MDLLYSYLNDKNRKNNSEDSNLYSKEFNIVDQLNHIKDTEIDEGYNSGDEGYYSENEDDNL